MEYDEWTPLGRGDPLKNDPTYDYVPPVLERVHYWMDPSARTPDPPLSSSPTGVLLLGVSTQKKTTLQQEARKSPQADSRRDHYDPLMHYIESPKFNSNRVRTQYIPLQGSYYNFRPQRPPYTMLVPPPPVKPQIFTSQTTMPAEYVQFTDTTTSAWDAGKTLATVASTSSPAEVVTVETTTASPIPPTTTLSPIKFHKEISPMIEIKSKNKESAASSFLQLLLRNEMATTQPPASSTHPTATATSQSSLTTDPLFSHYKQPAEPLRGPMYLIIQGHSKVKTYGASKLDKISGILVQDNNDVNERQRRKVRQIEFEEFIPVEEAIEAVVKDYVDSAGPDGSGIGQILSSLDS